MDIVYYVVVPIFTSLLGGLIAGLFTFLGVKMTLSHERKIHEADLKIKQAEEHKKEIEKNIERNKRIILTRPEMTITKNNKSIKYVEEICLLPYIKPELYDENKILFDYSEDIFKEDYWNKYEVILQNTGKRTIVSAFLHIPYKSGFNIYGKLELMSWQEAYFSNYYGDENLISTPICPNEKIKIIIYFPKIAPALEDKCLDFYCCDEDDNYWYQRNVNANLKCESEITAPETYRMHLQQDCNYWFIYDQLYYDKSVKKCFKKDISSLLEKRKQKLWAETEKQEKFINAVNRGEIELNYKLPLE